MRGVDPFRKLWARGATIKLPDGTFCNLLSLPDLVQAKKKQCDKDWVMLRRLLEAHFFQKRKRPTADNVRFAGLTPRHAIEDEIDISPNLVYIFSVYFGGAK